MELRSLPVRDSSRTTLPALRATQRSPSNLRSSSQSSPKSRRSVKVASISGITIPISFHVDVEYTRLGPMNAEAIAHSWLPPFVLTLPQKGYESAEEGILG